MGRRVRSVKNAGGNGNDAAVQGTNDNSIVSKSSMVDAGYFTDNFVKHFVNKRSRRSPLINRGYYVRAAAMEHVFQAFLKKFKCDAKQVVSLGAGFDSAYFRLKSQGILENTTYIEVDFPDVMQRKRALILNSPTLRGTLSGAWETAREIIFDHADYKLLGVDLTRLDQLDQCLTTANVDKSVPTLVLSEVVLTYLDSEASSSVIQYVAAYFESAMFVSYEQVSPSDSFGIVMMNHFCKLRSPLKSIDTYPGGDSQVERYTKLGWSCATAVDMNYFYTSVLTSPERQRVESLEPFDEFEEWHLKCSHYILLTAFKGACLVLRDTLWADVTPGTETTGKVFSQETSMHVPTCVPADGDDRVCDECSQALCAGCNGTDSTLVTQGETAAAHDKTRISCRKDIDATSSSVTVKSETVLEWTCLPPVEGGQRFGHSSAVVCSHYAVTVGGFGADLGRHSRMKTLLVHHVLNGIVIDVKLSGEFDREGGNAFERMYHTLTPVGSTSLLLFGGRLSPTKPCLQSFLLQFQLHKNSNLDYGSKTKAVSSSCDNITMQKGDADETGHFIVQEHCTAPSNNQNTVCMECSCQKLPTEDATPPPRWRHSAVSISVDESPHVIVFGGISDNQTVLNDCHMFNVEQCCWTKLACKGDIPCHRHSHTASQWNGSMVVACGLASDLRPLNSIFRLDVVSRTWTEVDIPGNSLRPRYSHKAAVIGDHLALVGGVCLTLPPPGVALVNLVTGVHQVCVLPQQDLSNPMMLHGHSMISNIPRLTKQQVVVVGGGGNCFSFGTHLNATPVLLILPT